MLENIATIVIISHCRSFHHWFRYICLLVLSAKPPWDYASIAVFANQLHFRSVQTMLQESVAADLDELKLLLDHDRQVLSCLLSRAVKGIKCLFAVEKRMLELDYWAMSVWYSTSSRFSRGAACRALDEMSCIVAYFANAWAGEQCVPSALGTELELR